VAWMRMMGAESVAYHRRTVLERGDDPSSRAPLRTPNSVQGAYTVLTPRRHNCRMFLSFGEVV
jgi:hypothetical protein